jgi:hypothetical protein
MDVEGICVKCKGQFYGAGLHLREDYGGGIICGHCWQVWRNSISGKIMVATECEDLGIKIWQDWLDGEMD